jgi:hypothetical protein
MLELDRVVPADALLASEGNSAGNGKAIQTKPAEAPANRADNPLPPDDEELSPPRFGRNPMIRLQPQMSARG